jgi:CubicO group peptidase (beta-lactamase class C family)
METRFAATFDAPRPANGSTGTVLREGGASEAGMRSDAVEKIDAVCREWAADSDKGFAVCIARRGVIFHHKAYGQRDGRPMTLEDRNWMASISKLLAATGKLVVR